MARAVVVDSGPLSAELSQFARVPREKWRDLVLVRRGFLASRLPHDCRCLVKFVAEADEVWSELGYKSADDLISRGYELDPAEVRMAVDWLKIRDPEHPISLSTALKLGKHGRPRKGEERKGDNITLVQRGTHSAYTLARLERDRPELAQRVRKGELSANAAAIEAGFRDKSISIPLNPATAAKAIRKHFTPEQIDELVARLIG